MDFISLPEVLKEMNTGNPFSISFVTADRKKRTGGRVISIPAAVQSTISSQQSKGSAVDQRSTINDQRRYSPDHYSNSTRNIKILLSDQVRKLHIRLITRFNGQKVRW